MKTNAPGGPLAIWTVTDGRAGNRAQALGLAEALGRRRPVRIEEVEAEPHGWAAMLPARVWPLVPAPGWPRGGYRNLTLPAEPPELIVGAGRRAAPLVAALGREKSAPTVQMLDPQMPPGAFTLVVAPAHDGLDAPNTLATVGSIGRLTPARIAEAAGALPEACRALPAPRLAVLLGGPSRSARWTDKDSAGLLAALRRLLADGYSLAVTPSRRTPAGLTAELLTLDRVQDRLCVWDGRGHNPYPGILHEAEAILVTEDSVNMASEAASTARPVHLFPLSSISRKLRLFQKGLIEHGAARRFAGGIGAWTYEPLAEADRIATEIDARLFDD